MLTKNKFEKVVPLLLSAIVFLVAGCSTNKYVVKDVDTRLDPKGSIDGEKIGLDDKKQIIIQKESSAEAELKIQQLQNYEQERKLTATHDSLSQCRREIADPRLNGNGQVTEIPEVDNMKGTPEVREEIGLNHEGELRVVKREFYVERLKLERRYGETIGEMLKLLNRYNRTCSQELGVARVKVGLPAERHEGRGHFTKDGTWVMERKAERNLDDAFEIRGPVETQRVPANQ